MSRIGKQPITIPDGVNINIEGNLVTVNGPKGQLFREVSKDMLLTIEGNVLLVQRPSDEKMYRSMHGLTRTLVANMVEGVTKGYQKVLEISGVGYRAAMQGTKLVLTLGYAHLVEIEPEDGMEIEVPAPNRIIVKGTNKEKVGALAATIRSRREPEPYKGKGIRYEGEIIRRKAGKTGAKGRK